VPLTLQDLTRIKTAFLETLKHAYHTRKIAPIGTAEVARATMEASG